MKEDRLNVYPSTMKIFHICLVGNMLGISLFFDWAFTLLKITGISLELLICIYCLCFLSIPDFKYAILYIVLMPLLHLLTPGKSFITFWQVIMEYILPYYCFLSLWTVKLINFRHKLTVIFLSSLIFIAAYICKIFIHIFAGVLFWKATIIGSIIINFSSISTGWVINWLIFTFSLIPIVKSYRIFYRNKYFNN